MRVLMVNTFHHARGGDATYTRGLTRLLERAGHEVVPMAMRHPDNDPSPYEHRFLPWVDLRSASTRREKLQLLPRALWSRRAARTCAALIRDTSPDIAHLQHIHRYLTPSILRPLRRANVPIVWTLHDYELICPEGHLFSNGQTCDACLGHRYHEAIVRRCKWGALGPSAAAALEKQVHQILGVWNQVDRFLCPSRFLADQMIRFGVPAARVVHRPNFVEPQTTTLTPLQPERPFWLYAGRLAREKGVDVAIEAARRLPEADLLICGTGPEGPSLRKRAAGLPHVRFLGHLPQRELMQKIQAAHVVAVPSRWFENFPYAVIEAQAAGRAVVASRIGGIPEQIRHQHDGVLVPPDDVSALEEAIRALLTDHERTRQLGLAAAARVQRELAPTEHLRSILTEYADVLSENGAHASVRHGKMR